jgi:hypothetical protein
LAYDSEGNAVAIKEYLPSALALRQPGEFVPTITKANLPVFRIGLKCFFEEGRALARIVHPNVVRVVNFFKENETVYMVMAYESGHTLQEHIARLGTKGSRLSESSICRLFNGVCAGLREVHANKLLHLDLAARNGAHDGGAQVRFERAQVVVDTELQVKKARIDALDFDGEGSGRAFAGGDRITCHA